MVMEFLKKRGRGIKKAVTIATIAIRTGLCRRTVEKRIAVLREFGAPILSNCDSNAGPLGIYLAQTDAQVEKWERQMKSRIKKVSRHQSKVCKKFYSRHQITLNLGKI
jgi:hypothetical protein